MKKQMGIIKSDDEKILDQVNGGIDQEEDTEEARAVRKVAINQKDNPGRGFFISPNHSQDAAPDSPDSFSDK